MAKTEVYIFEEGRLDDYDVVCPGCGNVAINRHQGANDNLSMKCPSCDSWLYEYSSVIVPHGDADKVTVDDIQRKLCKYWRRSRHSSRRKERFERAARDLGIRRYSADA